MGRSFDALSIVRSVLMGCKPQDDANGVGWKTLPHLQEYPCYTSRQSMEKLPGFIKRVQRGKARKYMIVEKYAFALFADQVQILAQSRDTLQETPMVIVESNHLRP